VHGLLSGNRQMTEKTEGEQMIKLAVINTDEASEERLLNCLRGRKRSRGPRVRHSSEVAHDVEKAWPS